MFENWLILWSKPIYFQAKRIISTTSKESKQYPFCMFDFSFTDQNCICNFTTSLLYSSKPFLLLHLSILLALEHTGTFDKKSFPSTIHPALYYNGVLASGWDKALLSYMIYIALFMPPFREGGAVLMLWKIWSSIASNSLWSRNSYTNYSPGLELGIWNWGCQLLHRMSSAGAS